MYLLAVTLTLTVLSPLIFTDVFADSFDVSFDKQVYSTGDLLTISGKISDFGMPVIAMKIYDPEGKILSANSLQIISQKTFTKTITLDSPFYDNTGEYMVTLDYGQLSENYYFVIDSESPKPITPIDDFEESEIILLYTDKKQYTDQDIIKITGLVSILDAPSVLMGIYDPYGMPTGFYFGSINSDLEFSTSFLVKSGVNFKVDGIYSIKAHYAEKEFVSFFEYYEVIPPSIDDTIDDTIKNSKHEKKLPKSTEEIISNVRDTSSKIKNPEIKKQTNLTVEDVELGKLLNQINLQCDSSTFTDTISYYDGMGPALYRLCKFDNSLNFFNQSLIDDPNNIEILVNKGSALGKLGYFSEAILYYDQAIQIDPNFLSAKNNKANALANLKHYDDAILLYNEIIEKNPSYVTAEKNLEVILSSTPQIHKVVNENLETDTKNSSFQEFVPLKKIDSIKHEKQKPRNFLEEVSMAFSSLGPLLGFVN